LFKINQGTENRTIGAKMAYILGCGAVYFGGFNVSEKRTVPICR